jgi:hypothetical protein
MGEIFTQNGKNQCGFRKTCHTGKTLLLKKKLRESAIGLGLMEEGDRSG